MDNMNKEFYDKCDDGCICGHCLHHESYPDNLIGTQWEVKE